MLAKRIIPCLDVKEGRVVKGINFVNLKDAGDPVEQAIIYDSQSADELVFLDITASYEKRSIMIDVVSACAQNIFMPLTVGGGIRTIQDIRNLLKAGADKVSINSAAVRNPDFLNEAVKVFGSQCIVVAIDAKKIGNDFYVFIDGGRVNTNKKVIDWLIEVQERGAGEILLTSMDKDGTKEGYDLELTKLVCENSTIPVIASGGAGKMEHIKQVFEIGADAALAASIFHFGEISIQETKKYLLQNNINVRI
ncbi:MULTISPECIES: imidazole glycerol phosphate synthase subunit HisF [Desulfurella]|jgi:cyclase|uniref:imidazole glycerol phosphate synthase subunit HisF n=1 Tax=Desulfurella TaxID=33001 RepID=UPI000CB5C179|nr:MULTISPECIES: imidazole glycerol phosphate synthase subunit HisF [Desulfurella]PMP64102.1 MAG: imidazole glycerol phosphate synthase subunit HisF [Desulfurella multipotens]PMP90550.1 MAG: imidazole glycerol phosphate synthase subunit HisF [Desulfurella sp.]HEX13442.1 imidazole glycerol phosphate synthase subunit HisF [Desulfurella acetivorans]